MDPCKRHIPGLQTAANIPTVNNSEDSGHMTSLKSVPLFPPDLSVNKKMEMRGWLDGTSLREKKPKKKTQQKTTSFGGFILQAPLGRTTQMSHQRLSKIL